MPAPTKGARLGGSPAHERMLLANLATELFRHRAITTTEARARRLRPYAERLVTFGKKGDLASRRRVMRIIRDRGVVHALFEEIAPTFSERPGGYTRITKIGPRKGDNAPMAVIELVSEAYSPKQAVVKEAEGATKNASKPAAAEAAELETPATETPATETAATEAAAPEAAAAEQPKAESAKAADEAAVEATSGDVAAEETKEA